MKLNIIRSIIILLLFGTFFLIFDFSGQEAEESAGLSKKVSETIVNIFDKNASKEEKIQKINDMDHIVRKLAHFSIYAVVGFLLMSLMLTYKISIEKRFIISFVLGCIYACSDEIHQLFVAGRSGEIRDVIIDTSGVFIGICICYSLWKLLRQFIDFKKLVC